MKQETRFITFETLSVTEAGEFTGIALAYGVLDTYNSIFEPHAAQRSIQEHPQVLLFADHDYSARSRIGVAYLEDTPKAVMLRGVLNLNDPDPAINETARKVYSDLKFYQDHRMQLGLSIGFLTLNDKWKQGHRHISDIDLIELSVVSFPSNHPSRVTTVREQKGLSMEIEQKASDFQTIFTSLSIWQQWDQMVTALARSMDSLLYDSTLDHDTRMSGMNANLEQFSSTCLEWFDRLLTLIEPSAPDRYVFSAEMDTLKTRMQAWNTLTHTERRTLLGDIEQACSDIYDRAHPEEAVTEQEQDEFNQLADLVSELKVFALKGNTAHGASAAKTAV